MNTNIEITNINKHFFCGSTNINDEDVKKQYTTKIVNYCFYSINELNISDIIKNILYYSNNYAVVEDYDFINIRQLNDKIIEKLNIVDENKYLIFKYKNENLIKFNDFLFNLSNPKLFIFHIIESFSYLLKSLIKLNENNVCFFDLSPENISFNLDCGEKPIIQNYQFSLQLYKLNEKYITNIIKKIDNYTHKPLEVHILFYLIKNEISTISYSFIEEICEVFTNNLTILSLFSEKYKESYKQSCIESLKKYINKPKSYIISDILTQNDKWDVYSLSIIYLHIFGNISRVFSLKQKFMSKIIMELYENIQPEPSKRNSLETLLENYDKLFNDEKDWNFVKNVPTNKMIQLFDILDK
jgi:hypothetical protein